MRHYHYLLTITFFLTLFSAQAQWTDGMNATYVIGKPDFTTNTTSSGTQGLSSSFGVAVDLENNKLYVADFGNQRVLRYSYPITENTPTAELVFGQADFTSVSLNRGGTRAANTLANPYGVAVYNGDLWIADYSNHRVLKFNNAYSLTSNGPNADVVLGQADFTSGTAATAQNRMSTPAAIAIDSSGNLWVAEVSNNRVVRFDNADGKSSGANADGVLGQSNFTTSTSTTTTQSSIRGPYGLAVDNNGRLWVGSSSSQRVTWYNNAASKSDGANADGVLGQPDFTSSLSALTQSGMQIPRGVAITPAGRLFVVVQGQYRVLIYNDAASKSNGANADNVLGQSSFTTSNTGTSQSGMSSPLGVAVTPDGKLFIGENSNRRVLMFEGTNDSPLPVELIDFSLKASGKNVNVRWTTASEVDNAGFEIFRSAGGDNSFKKIASYITDNSLRGLGSSAYGKTYSFKDENLTAGEYSYKLVDVAFDGTRKEHTAKSIVVEDAVSAGDFSVVVSPNPANEFLKVNFTGAQAVTLEIYSSLGEKLYSEEYSGSEGESGMRIPLSGFAQGNYTVRMKTDKTERTAGFTIVR